MALSFLAVLLLSFVPQFYWPDPAWRITAEEHFQINLPWSLSIQPLLSLESWILALAGISWFYAASSWRINYPGRKWFYFALSLVVVVLAVIVLVGSTTGNSTGSKLFSNWSQFENFLVLGGIAAFSYSICALHARQLIPLAGFVAACFAFLVLVSGDVAAGGGLFFMGMLLGYFLQSGSARMPKVVKLGIPMVLVALGVFLVIDSRTTDPGSDISALPEQWSNGDRKLIAKDSLAMIKAAPLSGHGLSTFTAIFPQYREYSANAQPVEHPANKLLWIAAESGILGLALLIGLVLAYLIRCRGLSRGRSGGCRLAALGALLIFILHSVVDVSVHQPGTIYLALLLAALALPRAKTEIASFKPRVWRFCGGVLVIVGFVWGLAGLSGLPLHSEIIRANQEKKIEVNISAANYEEAIHQADQWVALKPLDWRAYSQRAELQLLGSDAVAKAAADFKRARFAEPSHGDVAVEEGFAWIPYDAERAISAWRELLSRELDNREDTFQRIVIAASEHPELRDALALLSQRDPSFRVSFLEFQSGDYMMQELQRDLEKDARLEQFTRQQRTAILKRWIEHGDRQAAEVFLQANEPSLNRPWWLWSLLLKEQAEFEEAVAVIRSAITPPALPKAAEKEVALNRLEREFLVTPGDIMKGTDLIRIYLKKNEFQNIIDLTESMMAGEKDVPPYVSYWNAESYARTQDYIEGWYAYERYLEQIWEEEKALVRVD